MMSDSDLYKRDGKLSSLDNEETSINHDVGNTQISFDLASISEAKQSQRKSGKSAKSDGNCSKRSRVAHTEDSLNLTGSVDMNGLPQDIGSYMGKCNITEKMQTTKEKTNVSAKRSDKRIGKVPKSKCDSFSLKAGLSSFSSSAIGNNIFGIYGPKQDICDLSKHADEVSLNELLDGSYKRPQSIKDGRKKSENSNQNILHSIKEACSVLQLRKLTHTQNMAVVDSIYHQDASSCFSNTFTSGANRSDDYKVDMVDPSSSNKKVEDSCSDPIDHDNILKIPLFTPKDVFDRLTLPTTKDLDLLLLDSIKSSSKVNLDPRSGKPVHSRGGLPTFPWSHISLGHFKVNSDVLKLTPNKNTCQGRWVKMGNSTNFSTKTTTFLDDFESLTYDQSLLPLMPNGNGKSPLPFGSDATSEQGVMPSRKLTTASKTTDTNSPGALAAAQTLCDIASRFRKHDPNSITRWPKKPSQKSMRASKSKSNEKLEKALFTIPAVVPDEATSHTSKRLKPLINEKSNDVSNINLTKKSTVTSTSKLYRDNAYTEVKHHEISPMKRPFITPHPSRLSNKPPKIRKLVPMEWNSRNDQNGNRKY